MMPDRSRATQIPDLDSGGEAAPLRMQSMSPARRRLTDLMSEIGFGQIEGLVVQRGEPQFQPMPRVIREIKFGERETTQAGMSADAAPKRHVIELFAALAKVGDGIIERLEIRHGLPFRMVVAAPPAEREA
jgi:hypothetical protein